MDSPSGRPPPSLPPWLLLISPVFVFWSAFGLSWWEQRAGEHGSSSKHTNTSSAVFCMYVYTCTCTWLSDQRSVGIGRQCRVRAWKFRPHLFDTPFSFLRGDRAGLKGVKQVLECYSPSLSPSLHLFLSVSLGCDTVSSQAGHSMSNGSEPLEKKLKTGEDCIVVSANSRYGCKVAQHYILWARSVHAINHKYLYFP